MANNSYYRLYFGSHAVIVCECVREHISSIFPVNYCYSQEILFIFACISSYILVAYHIDILRERERAKREKNDGNKQTIPNCNTKAINLLS